MAEESQHVCAYHLVRYLPNLVRDEWVNIGVVVHDPRTGGARARLIEEPGEFARVRRLHPHADQELLRALRDDLQAQLDAHREDIGAYISKLDETLSNAVQFGPQKGILTGDMDAELDRLYRDHVAVPQARRVAAEAPSTRGGIRWRATQVFRSSGIYQRMDKHVRVEEFTYPGDRLRLDYAYRSNGTRGFVHALSLSRDQAQAKELAFTAEAIRSKLAQVAFAAVTEAPPVPGNPGHEFVARLLEAQGIELVPLPRLEAFANRLRPTIH